MFCLFARDCEVEEGFQLVCFWHNEPSNTRLTSALEQIIECYGLVEPESAKELKEGDTIAIGSLELVMGTIEANTVYQLNHDIRIKRRKI